MNKTRTALVSAIAASLLVVSPIGVTAQETDVGPTRLVEVTGTSFSPAGCTAEEYERPKAVTGVVASRFICSSTEGMPWSVSDPRLEGTVTRINEESVIEREDGPGLYVASVAYDIENDGGGWRERPRRWVMPDGYVGVGTDWLFDEAIVLDGHGDYEGLVAVLRMNWEAGDVGFRGFIMDARLLPPPPENASTE